MVDSPLNFKPSIRLGMKGDLSDSELVALSISETAATGIYSHNHL